MLFLKYAFFVFKFFEDGTEFHLHSKRIGRRDDEFCVFLSFGNDGQVEFRNGYWNEKPANPRSLHGKTYVYRYLFGASEKHRYKRKKKANL